MKALVTGAAGFIGFHLSLRLLKHNQSVVGLDNINNYYDEKLKFDRLQQLGIKDSNAKEFNKISRNKREILRY